MVKLSSLIDTLDTMKTKVAHVTLISLDLEIFF